MKLRVKEILKSKQITQKELADRMGMLPESLTRILAGGNPTMSTLGNMAKALNVNICDLFDNEKNEKKICGYIEFGNVIHKINSIEDLNKFYKRLLKK
jgi:transcriptional regulator with XRE-family HTH domain